MLDVSVFAYKNFMVGQFRYSKWQKPKFRWKV